MQLASVPERVPTQRRNVPNQYSVERLHTMLVELNNKRTEALTKFRADDRLVVELDQQITDTTAAMERAQGISANEESTDVNPAWQALVTERMKARLALSGLESKAQQLRRELAERQQAALAFTEAGPEYDAAVRRVTAARANHELYAKREEEARIAEVLDRQRISNVVLAQAPVVLVRAGQAEQASGRGRRSDCRRRDRTGSRLPARDLRQEGPGAGARPKCN